MSHRKLACNVLIVGGGPVGSSVAFHLAKAGVNNVSDEITLSSLCILAPFLHYIHLLYRW